MKMTPAQPTTTLRILPGLAALAAAAYLSLPAIASAQASSSSTTPSTGSTVSPAPEVVLDPFTVSTSQDKGYAATNEISGSRVDSPIKDIPISIDVITSQFISDIGATDLRSALAYQAGVMTRTQNDLENTAGSISGQTYGPGGVNNPQGVTSNPDQSQYKIRGFIATNTLRDGFLRLSGVDAVNIDRIEVVFGPNALLYGTGNFGGVVDYLPMRPMDAQSGYAQVSYGSYNFERATLAVTGPISAANHIDYSLAASYQDTGAAVGYYNEQHYFIAPQLSWRPTPTTLLVADVEYSKQWINGNGFQAFRGVSSTSAALPTNNDQFETPETASRRFAASHPPARRFPQTTTNLRRWAFITRPAAIRTHTMSPVRTPSSTRRKRTSSSRARNKSSRRQASCRAWIFSSATIARPSTSSSGR